MNVSKAQVHVKWARFQVVRKELSTLDVKLPSFHVKLAKFHVKSLENSGFHVKFQGFTWKARKSQDST